jgi:glycyl-tRNA synthetase beta chain
VAAALSEERYADALHALAGLRTPLDAFFDHVIVNAEDPEIRANRLRLLCALRQELCRVADLSKVEG